MNKNIIIGIIVVVILVLGGVWWSQSKKGSENPVPLPTQSTDTTGMIIQDADALDMGDIDKEFQDIDKDLQTL